MSAFRTFPTSTAEYTIHPNNSSICTAALCLEEHYNINQILGNVFSTLLTTLLAMVMFSMGCNVEAARLWGHIRRPWGIMVGLLCQFGLMPFIAFSLSMVFKLQPLQALVVLLAGCCPGGSSSNIITYWMDGDMDLSISMTTCSSILAMVMMPLCLVIYSSNSILSITIQMPYQPIGITLVSLLVPISTGMYVKHRWPQKARKILRVGSIVGVILIIIVSVVGGVLYKSSWNIDRYLWIVGAIFPTLGFSLGFFISILARQSWQRCRTIALETGFQNMHLCSTIVQLSFTSEQLEVIFSFPLIYTIFQMALVLILLSAYRVFKRYSQTKSTEDEAVAQISPTLQKDKLSAPENGSFQKFTKL